MRRPLTEEYPSYYEKYINLVDSDNILKELRKQTLDLQSAVAEIPEEKEDYAYALKKWTIKEVLGHIIDTERIFGYRALRFARMDKTNLPGFDENLFVSNANFQKQSLYSLAHEFALVREANLSLFKSFTETELDRVGLANEKEISVRAILFICVGHAAHHLNVIREKYLTEAESFT